MRYIITAKRTTNETVFFVESSHSYAMVPNAESLATKFENLTQAEDMTCLLKDTYKGLKNWQIELVVPNYPINDLYPERAIIKKGF